MTSILNLDRYAEPALPEMASVPAPEAVPSSELAETEEAAEFEVVVGRRQIASTSLVVIVLLAVFSGMSYLIGKSMAFKAAAATPTAISQIYVPDAPAPEPAPAPAPAQFMGATAPLVGVAIPGKIYLQVGVIDKGLAGIWAEGLRTHGLDSFVAPGPSDGLGLWRVLIGPLPDPQAYQRAKNTLDTLGLTNFGRRYPPQ